MTRPLPGQPPLARLHAALYAAALVRIKGRGGSEYDGPTPRDEGARCDWLHGRGLELTPRRQRRRAARAGPTAHV